MTPLAVLFAATLTVPAQSAPVDPFGGSSPAAAVSKAMQEDVETMRYVLARKLSPFVATTAWAGSGLTGTSPFGAYSPSSVNTTPAQATAQQSPEGQWSYTLAPTGWRGHVTALEGVYLPRVGVLYTVTLPQTKADPLPKKGDATTKAEPLTEWERAKMALDGKTPPASQPAARREPPLAEVLVKALTENAKNFRDLRDDERIAVVVTFRKPEAATALSYPTSYSTALGGLYDANVASTRPMLPGAASPGSSSGPSGGPGAAGTGDAAPDYDALAEIQLKRGDYARAIETYTATVKKATKDFEAADEAGRAEALKRVRAAYAKVAQAYALAGQYDNAKAAMDTVSRLDDKTRTAAAAIPKSAGPPPLPARLIVSATKRDLTAAAAGRLSPDELSKVATIEYSDPAATK